MAFLLPEHRDPDAARRLLTPAIPRHGVPAKITIDGSAAQEAAIQRYNAAHGPALSIRPVNYVHKMVEHDQRGVQRVTRPMLGVKSFDAAQSTLVGIALMHRRKKRQLVAEEGGEGLTPAEQFDTLAA